MNEAARDYIRALNDRNGVRRQPPHDIFELQNRVRNISSRLESSKAAVAKAAAARYGPQRTRVARPATQGLYVIEPGTLAVRRGVDGPSIAFWNVAKNEAVYLKRSNKNWVVSYGPDAGKVVQLSEHWTPGGLKR